MTTTVFSRLPAGTNPRRATTIALWVTQAALAALFAGAGLTKITGDPLMVDMFADIGAGQWLRYLVGTVELAGAAGLLIPRLAGLAALGLAGLMAGATATNVLVLDAGPALTIALFLVAAAIAWARRRQLPTASVARAST